jgi:hypothetical protein
MIFGWELSFSKHGLKKVFHEPGMESEADPPRPGMGLVFGRPSPANTEKLFGSLMHLRHGGGKDERKGGDVNCKLDAYWFELRKAKKHFSRWW